MRQHAALVVLILTTLVISTSEAWAQAPANDTCGTAILIGDGVTLGTTVGATTGPDPVGTCASNGEDVWYVYVASCTGAAVASLCPALGGSGTFDTVLTVWDGSVGCGSLAPLACDYDTCGTRSQVSWAATQGNVYYLSIGTWNSGTNGTFALAVGCSFLPPNDTCATAITVAEGSVTAGFNFGATTGPDPVGGCVTNSKSVVA
jgi:hypothetical protein